PADAPRTVVLPRDPLRYPPAPSMRFFEYESRAIVAKAGIPVTKHGFAKNAEEARRIAEDIGGPVVIKSQVLTGGRMKAGGVQFADTPDEAERQAEHVLNLEIGGHMPRGVLVDSRAAVKHEYYAGVVWDGIRKQPVMLFSDMDMENEARLRQQALLHELGVGDDETRQAREPTPFELAGEQVDAQDHRGVAGNVTEFDGNLGLVIGAGGGSLTLFDAVRAHGGRPANYCEIGGNPSVAKACGLAKLVLQKPGVERIAVMMSIVSNTRVDIVARGVIKACLELGQDPAEKIAIFRIPGAWEEEGFKILERYGVEYADRSVSLNEAARRAVEKIEGSAGAATAAGSGASSQDG